MIGKRCFFIGHRDAMQDIVPALERTVEALITHGVTEFFVGGSTALQQVRSFGQSAVIPILRWNCCCRITRQSAPSNPQTGLTGHFIPPAWSASRADLQS